MLSHRQASVNQAAYVSIDPDDDDDDRRPLTSAGGASSFDRRRTAAATSAAASINSGAGSRNSKHVRFSTTTSSHEHTQAHRCCCMSFRSSPTRKLHIAFCKALSITLVCLVAVFLLGMVIEPLIIEQDGWMDCVDAECSVVKARSTSSFMHVPVPDPSDSLLMSAYHKTDPSENHAISNPKFFSEWHERTVSDFLERQKKRAENIAEMIKPSDASEQTNAQIKKTLYQQADASIHTDISRTREIYDGEKMQLEKAYMNLVPWLPHHMRLGSSAQKGKSASTSDPLTPTKTTAPLLTRSMLDATTSFLTDTYPGCMWLRLWIVDSTMYVHSFNTRKVVHHRTPTGVDGIEITSSPTSVFGSESSRLNHFMMLLLHVLSSTLSTRLQADLQFFDLPPQPEAAGGEEDAFPNLDAVFLIGDAPCGNMTRIVEGYEKYIAQLEQLNRSDQSTKKSNDGKGSSTSPATLLETEENVYPSSFIESNEFLSWVGGRDAHGGGASLDSTSSITESVSDDAETSFLTIAEDVTTSTTPAPSSKSKSTAGIDVLPAVSDAEVAPKANPVFESILSFQNGYTDENTKAMLMLPRMVDTELSRREKIFADIRRGVYPTPPSHLAPIFTIRQPAAAVAPPPAEQAQGHSQYYSLYNHLFGAHQRMFASPNILLPDFTRWSQLVAMEEESLSASSGLLPPSSLSLAERAIREEGGLEEDVAEVAPATAHEAGEALPTIHAVKLHQLHNKQIAQLRSTQKLMLILSPLSGPNLKQRYQAQHDELELEGLANLSTKDMHNLESSSKPGTASSKSQVSLQQRMLRKLHILLRHRLVTVWDHRTDMTPEAIRLARVEGTGVLDDIMKLLTKHYATYSPLEEQRQFGETHATGFKLYDEHSIVPTSCHLPFVVYEESPVNSRPDGSVVTPPGGNADPNTSGSSTPLPGAWAQWLWTCDYLVLREVRTMPRPVTPIDRDRAMKADAGKKKKKPITSDSLPPLILPATNSFDEYWSVTHEPYKHYLPFMMSIETDLPVQSMTTEEHHAASQVNPARTSHPVLTQIQASFRTRLLQASVPGAFSTSAKILHLLPLLHQLFAADWTLKLQPHVAHKHEVLNVNARKKALHEEGTEHEEAAKEHLEATHPEVTTQLNTDDSESGESESDSQLQSFEERHSCSSHFTSLADSLTCLWCVRVSSRHWLRTVMSPEYIASYTRKLLTLYGHALKDTPTRQELEAHPELIQRMTKIKTQTEVREFIKQLVFSTQGMED